jgi:hypothetical protein
VDTSRLTSEDTWRSHWETKEIKRISINYSFHDLLIGVASKITDGKECIELGGFPGYFSVFLRKYAELNPTLIDFVVNEDFVNELLAANGLCPEDVQCIQGDIFNHEPKIKYDLVCSFGLVEHFVDMSGIVEAHVKYMKPGAILLITAPNFLGINGLLQRLFDPKNLAIHNLKAMNIELIKQCMINCGLTIMDADYYPSTQVWLENLDRRGISLKIGIRVLDKLMGTLGVLFGKRNKILSNNIYWVARL